MIIPNANICKSINGTTPLYIAPVETLSPAEPFTRSYRLGGNTYI